MDQKFVAKIGFRRISSTKKEEQLQKDQQSGQQQKEAAREAQLDTLQEQFPNDYLVVGENFVTEGGKIFYHPDINVCRQEAQRRELQNMERTGRFQRFTIYLPLNEPAQAKKEELPKKNSFPLVGRHLQIVAPDETEQIFQPPIHPEGVDTLNLDDDYNGAKDPLISSGRPTYRAVRPPGKKGPKPPSKPKTKLRLV